MSRDKLYNTVNRAYTYYLWNNFPDILAFSLAKLKVENYTLETYNADIAKLKKFNANNIWDKKFHGLSIYLLVIPAPCQLPLPIYYPNY